MDVIRTAALQDRGQDRAQLSRQVRAGTLVRIRHGAYAEAAETTAVGRHRQLIAATWPILGDAAVLSHASAAVLLGLPVWDSMLVRVCATRAEGGHGVRRPSLHVRVAQLRADDLTLVEGYRITSLARTAVDQACVLHLDRAVATVDAALRLGVTPASMRAIVTAARRRHGIGVARAAVEFADARSESVGESFSRLLVSQLGLARPELQVDLYDRSGFWIARSDFGWLEEGVIGEFDGRIKYTGTPDEVAHAVMREKAREQAIRDAGWIVVRWYWSDLSDPIGFKRRIETAFDQAASIRSRA